MGTGKVSTSGDALGTSGRRERPCRVLRDAEEDLPYLFQSRTKPAPRRGSIASRLTLIGGGAETATGCRVPRRPDAVLTCALTCDWTRASTVTASTSSGGRRSPNKPTQDPTSEPKIRVTPAGGRYVEPRDMFDHPEVRERLKKANQVATQLGIKGHGR